MANTTPAKTPLQSTNFWTGLATVIAALFSYFFISPDPTAAADLSNAAHTAVEAISAKNWVALFAVLINGGNILYHLFKK